MKDDAKIMAARPSRSHTTRLCNSWLGFIAEASMLDVAMATPEWGDEAADVGDEGCDAMEMGEEEVPEEDALDSDEG